MNGLTKQGDQQDRRCALGGQKGIVCKPLEPGEDDWCYGCKFYVCASHSLNISMMGPHDVMEHLDSDVDEEGGES